MTLVESLINDNIIKWVRENHADQAKQIARDTIKRLQET